MFNMFSSSFQMMLTTCKSVFFVFCFVNLTACGLVDSYYAEPAGTELELFELATAAMQQEKYVLASEYYTQLQDNFPFSPYALESELQLGDALFLSGKYFEATTAYKAFEELHPRNTAMPYVLYQIGMSLLRSNDSVDKTAGEAAEAILYFDRLISTYPESQYAAEAVNGKKLARTLLAERELYAAQIFWKMGNSSAAYKRYIYVQKSFPDLPEIEKYAEEQAKVTFLAHSEDVAEEERRFQHGSWHNYFDWL